MLCENKNHYLLKHFFRGKIINGLIACKNKYSGCLIHVSLLKSCKKRKQFFTSGMYSYSMKH